MTEHSSIYHRTHTVDSYNEIHKSVQQYIEARYMDRITLADFTQQHGISERTVQRALSWHGTTWLAMLTNERMERAKQLLVHSSKSVGAIANHVGYVHSQFDRTFKAIEGETPENYRKMQQQ